MRRRRRRSDGVKSSQREREKEEGEGRDDDRQHERERGEEQAGISWGRVQCLYDAIDPAQIDSQSRTDRSTLRPITHSSAADPCV